jgi:hypothetical protein
MPIKANMPASGIPEILNKVKGTRKDEKRTAQ